MGHKILFLTDQYLPFPTSNGSCVHKLKTAVSSPDEGFVLSADEEEGGFFASENSYKIMYKRKPSSLWNRVFGFSQDSGMCAAFTKKAAEVIREQKIDTVVCTYRPVECAIVGFRLKRLFGSRITVKCLFFDIVDEMCSDHYLRRIILRYHQKRLLKCVNKKLDGMVAFRYYKSKIEEVLGEETKNVSYMGIPNLTKPSAEPVPGEKEEIRLVYAGSFYPVVREPDETLRFLKQVCDLVPELTVHFYSWGYEERMEELGEWFGDRLIQHGRVSSEEIGEIIAQADCLLNIGNDLPHQVPGKLIEYFSTGKPIIGYVYREDDPANDDYQKYENMFLIHKQQQNDPEACAAFLRQRRTLSWEQVSSLFPECRPESIVTMITEGE